MEAQITAGMKTPVLSSRPGPEGAAGDKGKKREIETLSRTQSTEREEQVSLCENLNSVCSYDICCKRKKKYVCSHRHVRTISHF